ncbi:MULTISPECIES: TetR/AcrR family transcriptional regulator [Rhodobacterales]|uniref:TetR/AcrR family transcriptional regulator n=1 Tax=Roseobacter sp. N2S TaxID=2663844 RepID=UPI002866EFF6|nr:MULTISPECIES: TetR/AcrR family transcriptional regulator [Rhodobacterales]MDR6265659.1 AcrR family transcriptional regulator [Roseobacter sp. N2S]
MTDRAAESVNSEKSEVGRQGILNAAALLFRQHGYSGVSLRAVAQGAGIKAGSIYYHFASKDEIVTEILNAGILAVHTEVIAAVDALPDTAPAATVIHAALRGHLRSLLEHGDYTSANVRIFGQVPEAVRDANLSARRSYETYLDGLLSALQAEGGLRGDIQISRIRLMLIGALNATLEWFDPAKGGVDALADDYADILLNGLLAQNGAR